MAQSAKFLPCHHEGLSLIPRIDVKNGRPGGCTCNPRAGGKDSRILQPLARQSNQFDELQVNERPVSKDTDSVPEDNNQGCLLVSTCLFTQMNIQPNTHKHACKHTEKIP